MKNPFSAKGNATRINTTYNIPVKTSNPSYVEFLDEENVKMIKEYAKTIGIRLKNHIPIFRQ